MIETGRTGGRVPGKLRTASVEEVEKLAGLQTV